MTTNNDCLLSFPSWMGDNTRHLFCELVGLVSPFKSPADFQVCQDAKLTDQVGNTFTYELDTVAYSYHPAQIWKDGKAKPSKDASDGRNVLAVTYIDTFVNGDQNRYSWFDNNKFGNLYFVMTPGQCKPWSPVIEASGSGQYVEALKKFADTQKSVDRSEIGCKDDIKDYKKEGASIIAIIPGQGQSHPPDELPKGSKNQCEFVTQHTIITYNPGKLIYDIDGKADKPEFPEGSFCVRIMASQTGNDDPVLLQFPIDVESLLTTSGTLYFAQNADDQYKIVTGEEARIIPSLFKIGLTVLKNVQ